MGGSHKSRAVQLSIPCAEAGPYVQGAREFLDASERLGIGHSETYGLKCQLALSFFHLREQLEASQTDPIPLFRDALRRYAAAMQACADIRSGVDLDVGLREDPPDAASMTAAHYGSLFAEFDAYHYYEEPVKLLRPRLERNGFPLGDLDGIALDAGCGNGRYAVALRKLGFRRAIGVDFSPINIDTARRHLEGTGMEDEIRYTEGNVLDLPVPDGSCSFVFSNGVLHHTGNIAKGLAEIYRVLKPGGISYFRILPNPGGIYWDVVELTRFLLHDVPYEFARRFLALSGVPANRRYYILDHTMVPINERLTAAECETLISEAGFRTYVRCTRGADIDPLEQIYRRVPFAREKYGDGINLYRLTKSLREGLS